MKLLLFVVLFAALTYLAIRWMQDRGAGGTPAQRWPVRPKPPSRPLAPDDDEKFLRDLEWKRRQAERRAPKPPPDDPEPESKQPKPSDPADQPDQVDRPDS